MDTYRIILTIIAWTAALASSVVLFISIVRSRKRRKYGYLTRLVEGKSFESRVRLYMGAVQMSVQALRQLDLEIEERRKIVEELQKNASLSKSMLNLGQEQVDAVMNIVNNALNEDRKKTFRLNIIISGASFMLGASLTILVALLVR